MIHDIYILLGICYMCIILYIIYSVCTVYMPGARGSQKEVLDLLDLDFQKAVHYHVGTGNQNLGPLEEQPVLLSAKPSFQPPTAHHKL